MQDIGYYGNDLGAIYSEDNTRFRVWSPNAFGVELFLYDTYCSQYKKVIPMTKDIGGTWIVTINENLKNKYYKYNIILANSEYELKQNETVDPYAKCLSANGERGMIVNLLETNPTGWEKDSLCMDCITSNAIIYEIHVRDFSIDEDSGILNKGKYLAFTEQETKGQYGISTGLDHLSELGITHVHLMPVLDFASVDETRSGEYNWGYDPYHFFSPEGSYSTNANGGVNRIIELKKMVQALHLRKIGVILDVVYNHTYTVENSLFNKIAPRYFYRTDNQGRYTNGSGCGNELATERPMVRKFIIDSLKYWVKEYHIDGFRFDLMALIDIDTMKQIILELKEIAPNILLYGEPWVGGHSGLEWEQQFLKGKQRGLGVAVFNDDFRNALKGSPDGDDVGFISGSRHHVHDIKRGVAGSIYYDLSVASFAEMPNESINYASNHDNLTLWDKIEKTCYWCSENEKIRMHMLANAIVLTSQGIPFLHGGDEMLRSKKGHHNTYNAGDDINKINWERKHKHLNVFRYYKGLIDIRKNHPAFRMTKPEDIRKHLLFCDCPENTVMFYLKDSANGDNWIDIVVIYNPNKEERMFVLPKSGKWSVAVNELEAVNRKVSIGIQEAENTVTVKAISAMVLYM